MVGWLHRPVWSRERVVRGPPGAPPVLRTLDRPDVEVCREPSVPHVAQVLVGDRHDGCTGGVDDPDYTPGGDDQSFQAAKPWILDGARLDARHGRTRELGVGGELALAEVATRRSPRRTTPRSSGPPTVEPPELQPSPSGASLMDSSMTHQLREWRRTVPVGRRICGQRGSLWTRNGSWRVGPRWRVASLTCTTFVVLMRCEQECAQVHGHRPT